MLEDARVPSGLYNWEPRRGAENSMWDELIPPFFYSAPCSEVLSNQCKSVREAL